MNFPQYLFILLLMLITVYLVVDLIGLQIVVIFSVAFVLTDLLLKDIEGE